MCRKLTYLISFAFVLGVVLTSRAIAADPSLVGWWKFEEASGTLFDQSDNHNDGTAFNGVLYQQAGQIGYALGFDGADDYVALGTTGRPTDTFSFGGWFKTSVEHEIDSQETSGYGGVDNQRYAFDPRHGGDLDAGAGLSIGTNGVSVYEHGSDYMPATAVYETELGDDWNHVMIVYDNKRPTIYLNGRAVVTGFSSPRAIVYAPIQLGGMAYGYFEGLMDEVRIYNRALSAAEIKKLAARPKAWNPEPPSGSLHSETWITLGFSPGDFAVSHDVYMGESFEEVEAGLGDTYRGNQTSLYYVAGFTGYAYPDGLVPGTTYYWRIDEVNDADPNSPWKGDVWSFTIPSKQAYEPTPADGMMFVDPNVKLTWAAGLGAKLHTVYFGDNFDDVNNAVGGPLQVASTYIPGPLEFNKTYYWRVDEFGADGTYKGDVWSFTTTIPGLGTVVMERWENINSTDINTLKDNPRYPNNPDVTEVLTEFSWDLELDHYGGRIHGWLYAPATGDYTFWLCTDDQGELWLSTDDDSSNIRLIAHESTYSNPNSWGSGEEQSEPIPLTGGNRYYIMALWKEHEGGDHCQVAWQGPGVPQRVIIPGGNLSPYEPVNAYGAKPANRAADVTQTPVLQWKPGLQAVSHEVYFGADEDAVKNATTALPEYKGTKALGDESYVPGKLAWESTYYWRIDEVNNLNPESPWTGSVWSFTTAGFAIIDDFEDYDAGANQIWYAWHDGLGYGVAGSDPYFAGNGTGAAVGDETTASYTEETIVHGGSQSMPLAYDNNKQNYAKYSETEKTLTDTRDWTEQGVTELSLWFIGYPASTGSFVEAPVGTYTMTGSGADIWDLTGLGQGYHDEFHFAYRTLTGAGSITAKVVSVQNTNDWAKAGVMIRETLDAGSKHAFACITPAYGVASQGRPDTGAASFNYNQTGVASPYWVKLERSISGLFTVSHSANGTSFQPVTGAVTQTIPMASNVYIGLAVTSHDAALTCRAVFSNVTTTGNVSGQWAHQDIGILSNDPEPLYVAVSNAAGNSAIKVHDDPAAATIDTWTEWIIPLQAFADQGINLTDVDRMAIGLGNKGNATIPGGSGKIFIDDIRLYRPAP
jgi:hypothetical protein